MKKYLIASLGVFALAGFLFPGWAKAVAPSSDTTPPSVTSYTLNASAASVTFDPNTNSVEIVINTDEPVKFTRINILDSANEVIKFFTASNTFATTVTKTWDGTQTNGSIAPDGEYTLEVNIKDEANNTNNDLMLTPYSITIDTDAERGEEEEDDETEDEEEDDDGEEDSEDDENEEESEEEDEESSGDEEDEENDSDEEEDQGDDEETEGDGDEEDESEENNEEDNNESEDTSDSSGNTPIIVGSGSAGGGSSSGSRSRISAGGSAGQVLGAEKFIFTKDMMIGSTGEEVLELQKRLKAVGVYWGELDGIYGPYTEAAVKAYQLAHAYMGLKVDGIVGPHTRWLLNL